VDTRLVVVEQTLVFIVCHELLGSPHQRPLCIVFGRCFDRDPRSDGTTR
jgi:hypothetical protein